MPHPRLTPVADPVLCGREIRGVASALPADLDADAIARAARLPAPLGDIADDDCTPDAVQRLWRAILSSTDDPTLPFAIGVALPFGTYEVVDYLTSACATAGEAFVRLARFFPLVTPWFAWSCEVDAPDPIVILEPVDGSPEEHLVFVQYILGVVFGRFRAQVEGPFVVRAVELALPALPTARYVAHFDCPVRFEADATRVVIARASWEAPLARREAGLREVLERHAETLLAAVRPPDGLAPLRAQIQRALPGGTLALEEMAKALRTSPRTLQRRVREAGTTFQRLVEEEREAAARAYLEQPRLATTEIAFLVGYAEPSAFARAFRRWTGETPSEFRARRSPST